MYRHKQKQLSSNWPSFSNSFQVELGLSSQNSWRQLEQCRFFTCRMSFQQPNQQCRSTGRNTKLCLQRRTFPWLETAFWVSPHAFLHQRFTTEGTPHPFMPNASSLNARMLDKFLNWIHASQFPHSKTLPHVLTKHNASFVGSNDIRAAYSKPLFSGAKYVVGNSLPMGNFVACSSHSSFGGQSDIMNCGWLGP